MKRMHSPDPMDRMGVYKRLDDVPAERRLERFHDRYEGEDTYEQFLTEHLFEKYDSERTKEKYRLAGRRWREHIESRGRHHALAQPSDVETWIGDLLNQVSLNTVYNIYWVKLERFYQWLQRHPHHPHSYHPVLMAAAHFEHAGVVWGEKIARGRDEDD